MVIDSSWSQICLWFYCGKLILFFHWWNWIWKLFLSFSLSSCSSFRTSLTITTFWKHKLKWFSFLLRSLLVIFSLLDWSYTNMLRRWAFRLSYFIIWWSFDLSNRRRRIDWIIECFWFKKLKWISNLIWIFFFFSKLKTKRFFLMKRILLCWMIVWKRRNFDVII